ncbi:hypothetical protein CPB83DRAFT_865027 [Crepidotus variabilis]|uniref:Uncharacterized protein n=1 Tax=Crepidotus variabilis TaxID=179855 RepID=A0A9P6E3U8_9AGAR|nr:hypothetical protein CPB83DRAFT_865027 [Crepidotus variabilis]
MVSILKEEKRTFLQLVEELKKSNRRPEGRVAFLKANPICESCEEDGTECILSSSKTNVGCLPCSKTRKRRCPRQQAFGLFYIAKKMSKPLGLVLHMYEEYCVPSGGVKSGKAIRDKPTEKSQKRRTQIWSRKNAWSLRYRTMRTMRPME